MQIRKLQLTNFLKHENLTWDLTQGVNMLYAASASGKCITGDALIPDPLTGKLRTVNEIVTSDNWKIWALNKQHKIEISDIVAIEANGIKPVYELLTHTGRKIECTDNHRFLSVEGWKELKNFATNDWIAVPKRIPLPLSHRNITPETCRLLGYLIGDGGCTKAITFTNAEDSLLDDFLYCLNKELGWHCIRKDKKSKATTLYITRGRFREGNHRRETPIQKFTKEWGLWGKKSIDKEVPANIFMASDEEIGYFLGSLFDCDGYVRNTPNQNYLAYYSSSKKLIYGVFHLFLRLGIKCILRTKYTKLHGKKFTSYIITIGQMQDIVQFSKVIKLNGKKFQLLKNILTGNKLSNRNHSFKIPAVFCQKLLSAMKKSKYSAKELRKLIGLSDGKSYWQLTDKREGGWTYSLVEKLVKILNKKRLNKITDNDILWDKVRRVEFVGNKTTFDLQVKNYSNFIANDIIVHNSCIVEAIRFIQFPRETKGDSYIRQGSKKCSVKITYDNNISIERVKSKTVNQIIVTLPNGEVKEYTAFGKGEFPEDLQTILQLLPVTIDKESINLNILGQFDGHFLLDKSDTFKLKFFNYLTGSDVIDKVMQDLNKDILSCGREIKTNEEQLTNLKSSLNSTNVQYNEHKVKLDKVNSLYGQIIKLQEKQTQLQQLSKQLQDNEVLIKNDTIKLQNLAKAKQVNITQLKELNTKLQDLKGHQSDLQTLNASINIDQAKLNAKDSINKIDISQLKVLNDKLKFLSKAKLDLEKIDNTIAQLQEKLDTTVIAEIDFNKMRELVKKLEFLKKAQSDLILVDNNITRLSDNLHANKKELELIEQEKIDLLKNFKGICPILNKPCDKLEVK